MLVKADVRKSYAKIQTFVWTGFTAGCQACLIDFQQANSSFICATKKGLEHGLEGAIGFDHGKKAMTILECKQGELTPTHAEPIQPTA